jgi:hypothetical protein
MDPPEATGKQRTEKDKAFVCKPDRKRLRVHASTARFLLLHTNRHLEIWLCDVQVQNLQN